MARNFLDIFDTFGKIGQGNNPLFNFFNSTTSFSPDTTFVVTPPSFSGRDDSGDHGHSNGVVYGKPEPKQMDDHTDDGHADNGKSMFDETEVDAPTLVFDIPVVDTPPVVETPTLTVNTPAVDVTTTPKGDHNDDGHADNGDNGKGHDKKAEKDDHGSDKKEKGDHNDDGHPDNGKDDDVVDPDPTPDSTPDPLPTLLFTPENDTFNFNDYAEVLPVADANDGMHDALAGDDIVYLPETQAAADAVGYDTTIAFNGGDGNDIIYGGDYDDIIRTGVDNRPDSDYDYDSHSSGTGNDIVFGGGGDDIITGDLGSDELHGGDGNDTITANGNPWMATGGDSIYGDAGNDILRGSYGDDYIEGGTGNDYLEGQNGNDILDGGTGLDSVHGGKGDDTLIFEIGDGGGDKFWGDDGNDTLQFNFDTIDDMMGSLEVIELANDHATSDSASTAWHNSSAGFSMVGIENVTAYVGGEEVNWESYTSVPDTSMDVTGADASGFDAMI